MENEEAEMLLPLGSVVTVKDGDGSLLMIVSRAAISEVDGVTGYFDYAAVNYPNGVTDINEFMFFNRENVESIQYFGFINADEQIFADNYDDLMANQELPRLSVESPNETDNKNIKPNNNPYGF